MDKEKRNTNYHKLAAKRVRRPQEPKAILMNNHVLQKNKHSPPARHSPLKNRRRRTEKGYDLRNDNVDFHPPTRPCIVSARIVYRDGL